MKGHGTPLTRIQNEIVSNSLIYFIYLTLILLCPSSQKEKYLHPLFHLPHPNNIGRQHFRHSHGTVDPHSDPQSIARVTRESLLRGVLRKRESVIMVLISINTTRRRQRRSPSRYTVPPSLGDLSPRPLWSRWQASRVLRMLSKPI